MSWFDATQVDPAQGSSSLPLGKHLVVIKNSTEQATSKGDGGMLVFTCLVIEGEHKGVEGAYRLNLWNPSPMAKEIAGKQLSALCHVIGQYQLNGNPKGVELFNKPFFVQVTKQKDTEYTEISAVFDAAGNPPVKGQAPAQQQAPQQQQQPPASFMPGGAAPQQPAGQPSWQQPGQGGQQPAYQPPQQPAQQAAPNGQAPAPSWAQQPAGGNQPSWARN